MAATFNCKCPERAKPVAERSWYVVARNCHHSAFNGYHQTSSDWSTVRCAACCCIGRTKAGYVPQLPNAPADWASRR